MTGNAFPDVREATLDRTKLRELFFDIESQTELIEIRLKSAACGYAVDLVPTLAGALTLIERRAVLGVQIRYRWRGTEWRDTLVVMPEGARLVRSS